MTRLGNLFGVSQSSTPSARAPKVSLQGYPAWDKSDEDAYVQMLLTNTFGQTFYTSQRDLIKQADGLHTQMIEKDPEFVAKAIVYARNEGYMRSQPIYGLAKLAAYKGEETEVTRRRALVEDVLQRVIRTPNDLEDFLTVANTLGQKLNGIILKRAVARWLNTKMSEYWAIKYGASSGQWPLKRIVRHFHPEHTELFRYLRRTLRRETPFEVDLTELPQIRAFEALKTATSAADKVRLIKEGRLPHEVATTFAGNDKEVWEAIVPNLPIFALLKNLSTLERHGVLDNHRAMIEEKFTNPEIVQRSKILPFRFLTAAEKIQSAWAKDALRDALDLSFDNLPDIQGRTAIGLDISGSMDGQFLRTASIFAISLMKKANLNGRLLLFDTRVDEFTVSKRDSTLTQAARIRARGGTNTSLPIEWLLKNNEKVDNFILITDEQQNNGTPVYDRIFHYRAKLNPKLNTVIVDVASYRHGLADPTDPQVHYIFGWSDRVLDFIAMTSKGWAGMAETIRKG